MIRISPFTPLFFSPSTDSTALGSRYTQTFAVTDHILIQLIGELRDTIPKVSIVNLVSGNEYPMPLSKYPINENDILYFCTFQNLMPSYYSIRIDDKESEMFKVTDNRLELEDTILVQYSMKDNRRRRDAVFFIESSQQFFDFRIPGGFKDNGWSFSVDCEQFVTQDMDTVNLYAMESTQKVLTMGTQIGCPIWFAELLNRLLCCDYVYFDGVRYSRKEASVPEPTEQIDGGRSFVVRQILQKVVHLDPTLEARHQLIMRRVDDDNYRKVDDKPLRLNL